ncbi:MAG TPA: gamma-glutamyltransferase [Bryobacteraceae bacterium]|nr:gamma-glutamyltransferase [Bryobacteraceae bacterium]
MTRKISILPALSLAVVALAREPVHARHAMVVAQEPLAADAGVRVLQSGGNAVDAAVAVGFALAVTYPFAGNLGGGGFMLVRLADGHAGFIDFRERAPLAATHDMYLDSDGRPTRDSVAGWRASGVPGTVRGLELAHRRFGRMPWRDLVQPAVDLARDGFPLSWYGAKQIEDNAKLLARYPDSRRIFLGRSPGDKLVQPELASTLARIRDGGAGDFYEGRTAHLLADTMRQNGGAITLEDLKLYRAVERQPLTGRYKGYEVITSPPPSSGGVGILQMLAMLEGTECDAGGAGSASEYHYLAEVMRRFYADRSNLGDPDFTRNPLVRLLDPAYIASRRASIQADQASDSNVIGPGAPPGVRESSDTTHFNVVDAQGNAVAVTYTLNGGFGSGITVPGAGFLLNNEMDDFAAKPGAPNMFGLVQGEANSIQPGKRPLSSMTPTILTRDAQLALVLGAPGGGRIINGVLQVIVNMADFGMNIQDAVDWPRVHHQWKPDTLFVERGVSPDTVHALEHMGYHVERSGSVALVQAVAVRDGWLEGAVDGRGSGKAAGY